MMPLHMQVFCMDKNVLYCKRGDAVGWMRSMKMKSALY